jgi:hypothetical protein
MRKPNDRSMPLTAAMARFVDVADVIRSRAEVDEVLRDLCEDYRLAREILARMKKERPKPSNKVAEYSSLVAELEDEIMTYLLSPGQRSDKG